MKQPPAKWSYANVYANHALIICWSSVDLLDHINTIKVDHVIQYSGNDGHKRDHGQSERPKNVLSSLYIVWSHDPIISIVLLLLMEWFIPIQVYKNLLVL